MCIEQYLAQMSCAMNALDRRRKTVEVRTGKLIFLRELVLFWWFCAESRVGGGAAKVQRPEKAAARFSRHKA